MKTVNEEKHENEPQENVKYVCPMHCEGCKTYDKPGNCPKCNMKLVPVKK